MTEFHRGGFKVNKTISILLIVVGILAGFIFGMSYATNILLNKGIYAASVMLDVELTPKVKQMILGSPDLMLRISDKEKIALGLNTTADVKDLERDHLNETLNNIIKYKYPKIDFQVKGGNE